MSKKKVFPYIWLVFLCAFGMTTLIGLNKIEGKRRFFVRSIGTFLGWQERLYTPTQIEKIGPLYFIVDCWHNRVIYNTKLDESLSHWLVLDDDLAGPHSIATDSRLVLIEDTGRNGLRVYRYDNEGFHIVQFISGLGRRTHRVKYDSVTSAFYVLSSNSQEITKLKRIGDSLRIEYRKSLPFLEHSYTRSFSFMDGHIFFVAGPGRITEVEYVDDTYRVINTYNVPPSFHEMNDLVRIGNYYYVTATPRGILRAKSLAGLQQGTYTDMYQTLGLRGTPYYFSVFDGRVYLPQIEEYSGIISFVQKEDSIFDLKSIYDFGPGKWIDVQVMESLPK